jgi:hypothetical protein
MVPELENLSDDVRSCLLGAGVWSSRARLEGWVTTLLEALEELVNPAPGDAVVFGQLGWAAMFQDDGVDDVPVECGHAPPPRLVVSTMSCDICLPCPEIRHRRGYHSPLREVS